MRGGRGQRRRAPPRCRARRGSSSRPGRSRRSASAPTRHRTGPAGRPPALRGFLVGAPSYDEVDAGGVVHPLRRLLRVGDRGRVAGERVVHDVVDRPAGVPPDRVARHSGLEERVPRPDLLLRRRGTAARPRDPRDHEHDRRQDQMIAVRPATPRPAWSRRGGGGERRQVPQPFVATPRSGRGGIQRCTGVCLSSGREVARRTNEHRRPGARLEEAVQQHASPFRRPVDEEDLRLQLVHGTGPNCGCRWSSLGGRPPPRTRRAPRTRSSTRSPGSAVSRFTIS